LPSFHFQTNDNQLPELRAFAAKQGWEVICEYFDVVSGSGKKDRSQFQAMMVAASQRKFDLLLRPACDHGRAVARPPTQAVRFSGTVLTRNLFLPTLT
jgi:hypothetical protein